MPYRAFLSIFVIAVCTHSQGASLGEALRGSAWQEQAILTVTPVDLLPAKLSTLSALVGAMRNGILAATPTHAGRGGHPVVVRRSVLRAYETGAAPSLRSILANHAPQRVRIEVDDENVLGDFDTPEDVKSGEGRRNAAPFKHAFLLSNSLL